MSQLFRMNGFEPYCPLTKSPRKWSDRQKMVDEPLFKGYVFVRLQKDQINKALSLTGVVRMVYWNGKPAIIKEEEIQTIRRFMNEHDVVYMEQYQIKPGMEVVIQQGLFTDQKGVVVNVKNNQVELLVPMLGVKLVAHFSKNNVRPSNRSFET